MMLGFSSDYYKHEVWMFEFVRSIKITSNNIFIVTDLLFYISNELANIFMCRFCKCNNSILGCVWV